MNNEIIFSTLLISGFALVMVATFVRPPIYGEPSPERKLELIERQFSRWRASSLLFAFGGLVTGAGLVLLSIQANGRSNPTLLWASAIAITLGMLFWTVFIYVRTNNPQLLIMKYEFTPDSVGFFSFTLIGLFLYGILFIQLGYPAWLGYGTSGFMLLSGLWALISPKKFFRLFIPQILFFFTLVAGIMTLLM